MTEVEKSKRTSSSIHGGSPSVKSHTGSNNKMTVGRARSNSRSSGSRSQPSFDQFELGLNNQVTEPIIGSNSNTMGAGVTINVPDSSVDASSVTVLPIAAPKSPILPRAVRSPPITTTSNNNNNLSFDRQSVPPPTFTSRNRYTHILILRSLNGTFETKYLVIPFKPDALKLGRPVVSSSSNSNNGNNNNGNGSSGGNSNRRMDASSMVRPDNGNFDSRVLSRNHASLCCDGKTGKIYIKDLKSSNGTFLNGNRIDQEYVELKVGDVIDLGTDIDTKFEHRKISAFVEEISVIPLIDGITELPNTFTETQTSGNDDTNKNKIKMGVAETIQGHSKPFTESLGKQGQPQGMTQTSKYNTHRPSQTGYPAVTASMAQRAAFEAAMFGDINNLDIEDAVLGPETEILSGIFINNSIGTSPNLINVIKSLATEIALEKQEFIKLKSIENFLINYTTNLEYVNKLMMEMNDKQLVKLQTSLKQQFTEKHDLLIKDTKAKIEKTKNDANDFKDVCNEKSKTDSATIRNLEMQVDDLNTRLEVEKYKNSQLQSSATMTNKKGNNSGTDEAIISIKDSSSFGNSEQADQTVKSKQFSRDSQNSQAGGHFKGTALLTVTAVSVGFIAFILKYSSK